MSSSALLASQMPPRGKDRFKRTSKVVFESNRPGLCMFHQSISNDPDVFLLEVKGRKYKLYTTMNSVI